MRSVLSRAAAPLAIALAITLTAGSVALANHPWSTYHWARAQNPLALQLGDNVDDKWQAHLVKTSSDWNSPETAAQVDGDETTLDAQPWDGILAVTTSIVPGGTSARKCRPIAGTAQVCNERYGKNRWLGLAQIWLSGGHIVQGVAKLNDTYFNTARYNNPAEKQHVMCQEVAHTFGLGHTSEDGTSQNSCMDYFSHATTEADGTYDFRSTEPSYHDFEQLAAIYGGHVESGAGGAVTTRHGRAPVFVTGSEADGTPRGASPSRGRLYAQDLGNGRIVITHVYWAD